MNTKVKAAMLIVGALLVPLIVLTIMAFFGTNKKVFFVVMAVYALLVGYGLIKGKNSVTQELKNIPEWYAAFFAFPVIDAVLTSALIQKYGINGETNYLCHQFYNYVSQPLAPYLVLVVAIVLISVSITSMLKLGGAKMIKPIALFASITYIVVLINNAANLVIGA